MRHSLLGLVAATAIGFLSLPMAAAAQAPSEPVLRSFIEAATGEIAAMAALFGWTGQVEWQVGGALDTNGERVSLDLGEIARLIETVEPRYQQDAVRTIVAHEVWHYVDYRQGTLRRGLANSDERRIYECRADLMAGRYIASTDPNDTATSLEWSGPKSIANQLWRKTTPDHPAPMQRERAAQFGNLTVVRERPGLAPEIRQAIDLRLGIRDGEPLEAWSKRACEKIAQAQRAAVNRLLVTRPETVRRAGKTYFTLSYTNNSSWHMEVTPTITALYYGDQPGSTERSWSFPEQLRLKPGQKVSLERELPGLDGAGPVYYSVRPDEGDALISARFVAGPPTVEAWAIAPGLPAADTAFALAVQALANDALNGFSQFRGGGASLVGRTLVVDSTLPIPGMVSTSISVEDHGGARVAAMLYTGDSPAEAASAFAQIRARIQRIWPSARLVETGPDEFTVKVSRYSEISVALSRTEDRNYVWVSLRPKALGLLE